MNWIKWDETGPFPPERRYVLVQLQAHDTRLPAFVAVGFLRHGSGGAYMVVPAVSSLGTVTHYCDCLGDDFEAPLWPGTQSMYRTRTA